jgi:hypothetical protein
MGALILPAFAVLGLCLGVVAWQLAVWMGEIRDKVRKYEAARALAFSKNKPLLVAGGPWGNRGLRRLLRWPAHGGGDVCLDIERSAIAGHPNAVVASVTHIPFLDKRFGAAFASHLLEHLPSAASAKEALAELNRVSEAVFIAYPSRQSIGGRITPGHKLWVWQKGDITYFREKTAGGGCESASGAYPSSETTNRPSGFL